MIKEGKTPTPSALFARSQSKKDPESGKVFIDERKNMRHLGLRGVLKRGHKRQKSHTTRFQVDGVRNSPFMIWELALLCFIRNPMHLLPPLVPHIFLPHILSCKRT